MSVVNLSSSTGGTIPLEVIQLNNTLLNMISSNQEYFLGLHRLYYYAVSDEILLILENTPLNKQIIDNYTIDFDSTRLFSLKFMLRSGSAIELGIQQVLYDLGASLTIISLNDINAVIYSKTNSYLRGAELIGNDFDANEIILYQSNNKLKTSNKLITDFIDINSEQNITGLKTFDQVNLTNLTTPTDPDLNKILTVRTSDGRIQKSAFTPSTIVRTDTDQNIAGNKIFDGVVKLSNLSTQTGAVAKVLIKNQTTNSIEEANIADVINSTSTASAVSTNVFETSFFQLRNRYVIGNTTTQIPYTTNDALLWITTNINNFITLSYIEKPNTPFLPLPYTYFDLVSQGIYKFDISLTLNATQLTGGNLECQLRNATDNSLIEKKTITITGSSIISNILTYQIYYVKTTSPLKQVYFTFNNLAGTTPIENYFVDFLNAASTCIVTYTGTNTVFTDIQNDTTATNNVILIKADGSIVKNTALTPNTIALKSDLNNYTTLATPQNISAAKTFLQDKLILNPITTAASNTNKLLTRNATTSVVEESNLLVSDLVTDLSNYSTLNTNQNITAIKTFEADKLKLNPITTAAATTNKLLTRNQTTNIVEETNLAISALVLQTDLSAYVTKAVDQTITGVKTFEADKLKLNPITSAAATTNKLLTRNQTSNVVEQTNIAVSDLSLKSEFGIWAKWLRTANMSIGTNYWCDLVWDGAVIDYVNVNATAVPISTTDGISFTNTASSSRQFIVTWGLMYSSPASASANCVTCLRLPDGTYFANNGNTMTQRMHTTTIINLSSNTAFRIQFLHNDSGNITMYGANSSSYLQISLAR